MSTLTVGTIQSSTTAPPVIRNSSNIEVGRVARAWVNFRGSDGTIDAAFNVSSVTRTATGTYTINFANSLGDTLYAVIGSASTDGSAYNGWLLPPRFDVAKNATNCGVITLAPNSTGVGLAYNPLSVYVVIYR